MGVAQVTCPLQFLAVRSAILATAWLLVEDILQYFSAFMQRTDKVTTLILDKYLPMTRNGSAKFTALSMTLGSALDHILPYSGRPHHLSLAPLSVYPDNGQLSFLSNYWDICISKISPQPQNSPTCNHLMIDGLAF